MGGKWKKRSDEKKEAKWGKQNIRPLVLKSGPGAARGRPGTVKRLRFWFVTHQKQDQRGEAEEEDAGVGNSKTGKGNRVSSPGRNGQPITEP